MIIISGSSKLFFIHVSLVFIFQILFQLTDIEKSKNQNVSAIINLLAKEVGQSENNKHIPQEQSICYDNGRFWPGVQPSISLAQ